MFECTTDQFLIHLATAADRDCDPETFLEESMDKLGRHPPMSPHQEAILVNHLRSKPKRPPADRRAPRKRIPEAA